MRFFLLLLSLLALAPAALAQNAEPDKYVKLRLLPERSEVKGGEEIWIGIEQSIHPEWHTYWLNPGDSGAAPRINWNLPENFLVSDLHWPAPEKIPYGPLANYGYSDHVILLQKMRLPENLPAGPIELSAEIDILVCKDICIPESGTYTLTLNNGANEDNAAWLQAAQGKLPLKTAWDASYYEDGGNFVFEIKTEPGLFEGIQGAAIFPAEWGLVHNAAKAGWSVSDGTLRLSQKRGERSFDEVKDFEMLVALENAQGQKETFSVTARPGAAPGAAAQTGYLTAILFALLGGVILNLMPCVFPVLSIKALSLVKYGGAEKNRAPLLGLSYTAGIISSFLGIAALLITLQTAGSAVGWGFQLQNPVVVALLAYLLFVIGLNLSGLFEISGHFGNLGNKLTQGSGLASAFFSGILATIVATPCTAPFMAAALGYALLQPPLVNLSIFAALGFGLALPFLLLSIAPPLRRFLPKPGAWMETFRQFLAFPMFASAAWLVWVLSQQAGSMGVLGILMGMVAIAFGLWLLQHRPAKGALKIITTLLAILSFVIALGFLPTPEIENDLAPAQEISMGEKFTPEKLETYLAANDPVFVEMTAAWCITCKLNHSVGINTGRTREALGRNNVRYLIGDWTNYDEQITTYLKSFERSGVPIYVYYPPRKENGDRPQPVVLPQLLTPLTISETIARFAAN